MFNSQADMSLLVVSCDRVMYISLCLYMLYRLTIVIHRCRSVDIKIVTASVYMLFFPQVGIACYTLPHTIVVSLLQYKVYNRVIIYYLHYTIYRPES